MYRWQFLCRCMFCLLLVFLATALLTKVNIEFSVKTIAPSKPSYRDYMHVSLSAKNIGYTSIWFREDLLSGEALAAIKRSGTVDRLNSKGSTWKRLRPGEAITVSAPFVDITNELFGIQVKNWLGQERIIFVGDLEEIPKEPKRLSPKPES